MLSTPADEQPGTAKDGSIMTTPPPHDPTAPATAGQPGPGVPPPPPNYGYQPMPEPQQPMNTLAIIAFVASFFVSLAGIICGHIALGQIKKTGQRGRGLALAGTIIGYVVLALEIIAIIAVIVVSAIAVQVVNTTPTPDPDAPGIETTTPEPDPELEPESQIDEAGGWTPEYCAAWEAYRFADAWYADDYSENPERQAETEALMRPLAEIASPQQDYWKLAVAFAEQPEPVTPEEKLQNLEDSIDVANGQPGAWDASDQGCGLE